MAADKKNEKLTSHERYVCTACGGVYFAPVNGVCPGCKGPMKLELVQYDEAGRVVR